MSEKIVLTKMELLKMARELVINEYIDQRAQDHNKWLTDAELAWKTKGVNLPYPSFPVYPTEVDILSRATVLNTFLSQDSEEQKAIVDTVELSVPAEVQEVKTVATPEPVVATPPVTEVPVPTITTSIPPVELPAVPTTTSTPTVMTPEVLTPDVWANVSFSVVEPVPKATVPVVTEAVKDDATLSMIEQLKVKLGIK